MHRTHLAAWSVHVLTASGAALALLALVAAGRGAWQLVFVLSGIALVVDAVDGPMARRLKVAERLPWFDGATLDIVVDTTTYVMVPALVIALGDLVPPGFAVAAGVLVAIVGALYLADTRMKTAEAAFRGFPAVWNAVVFQLLVYDLPPAVNLGAIVVLAVMTFVPVEFVHPWRVRRLRGLTAAAAIVWGISAALALAADFDPPLAVVAVLAAASAYFAGIGAFLQLDRRRRRA